MQTTAEEAQPRMRRAKSSKRSDRDSGLKKKSNQLFKTGFRSQLIIYSKYQRIMFLKYLEDTELNEKAAAENLMEHMISLRKVQIRCPHSG